MKILLVNTYDNGGAANACIRLHQGLLNQGVASKLLLLHKTKDIEKSFLFKKNPETNNRSRSYYFKRIQQKIAKKWNLPFLKPRLSKEEVFLKSRAAGLELFSSPYSKYDITNSPLYQEADIINLHWVAGFLDHESFFKKNKKPVIWTLHDMHPFTGGEHYVEMIHGIDDQGMPVKRNVLDIEKSYSKENLDYIINSLELFKSLSIVAPSKWLQSEASKSELFKTRKVHLIPYGLDVNTFKNRDKTFARELYSIPLHKKVIIFVADSIFNNRKGYVYLKRALEKLDREDIILCSIGKGKPVLETDIEVRHLGSISDERIISLVYSLADVFVIPSLMDNLPNTVLESLLCGTPVIGFPIGGIPDMIKHGKNGLLTTEVSVDSLKEAIEYYLLNGVAYSKEEIRTLAVEKYDQSVQAKTYEKLFLEIHSKNN
jgi:glycosyltransferase involved in cell wall biosynthesis